MEKKPEGYKRRGDFKDLPFGLRLGVVLTELRWATEEGDTEQIRVLQIEADRLKQVMEELKPKPYVQQPGLPYGMSNIM